MHVLYPVDGASVASVTCNGWLGHVRYRFSTTSPQPPSPIKEQGLRPVQIWVPDDRVPGFAEEAHRQARAVAASEHAEDDQAFVDAASVWPDD